MSNLVTQYGSDWFYSKFSGSFFRHEGAPFKVIPNSGSRRTAWIPCLKLEKNEEGTVRGTEINVNVAAFTDVSVFSVPNLGWRSALKGKYLAYYYRNNNSYHRGLSSRNMAVNESAMTRWLSRHSDYNRDAVDDNFLAYTAMCPEFLPLTEGVAKMARGEILSFAVSPTVAVLPNDEDSFAVMFKEKVAGHVSPDGNMSLVIPELNSYMENV